VHTYHHPPPLPSTLSGLLKSPVEKMKSGSGIGSRSRAATAKSETSLSSEMNNNNNTGGGGGREQSSPSKSPSKKKKGSAADQNNNKSNFDEVTHDRLFRIADDKIETSDNFLVKTKNNRIIRVMLSDYDELDDSRINVSDLRKLLFLKPAIAELLYEEMLEIGLVEEEWQPTEDDEDEDTEDQNTHVETEVEEDETEIGTPRSTMNFSPDRRPTAHGQGNDKRVLETRKSSEKDENESRFGDEEDSGEGLHRMDSADL
jgi:hypothetical protein